MEEVHDLLAVEEVLARVLGGRDGGGEGAAADGGGPRRGAGAGALELVVVGAERERRRRRLQKHPRAGRRPARGGRGWRRCRRGGVVGGRHRRAVHGGGGAERGVGWGNFLGVARAARFGGARLGDFAVSEVEEREQREDGSSVVEGNIWVPDFFTVRDPNLGMGSWFGSPLLETVLSCLRVAVDAF